MLRLNLFACARDIVAGIRRPQPQRSQRESSTEPDDPRREGQTSQPTSRSTQPDQDTMDVTGWSRFLPMIWTKPVAHDIPPRSSVRGPGFTSLDNSEHEVDANKATSRKRVKIRVGGRVPIEEYSPRRRPERFDVDTEDIAAESAPDADIDESESSSSSSVFSGWDLHGTILSRRRPVEMNRPVKIDRWSHTQPSQDISENEIDAGDVSAGAMERGDYGGEMRSGKGSRRVSIRFGPRAPEEDHLPQRLPDKFNFNPTAETTEVSPDPEIDRSGTSSLRPLLHGWNSQHAATSGLEPVVVDIPRRIHEWRPAYPAENKPEGEVHANDATAQEAENRSGDTSTRSRKKSVGLSLTIGGRAPVEVDVPRRLPNRFSEYEIPRHTAAEIVAAPSSMTVDGRLLQPMNASEESPLENEMD